MCQHGILNGLIILLIINFILLTTLLIKTIREPIKSHRCKRVRFSVNGYNDELNFYKSLSPLEQKEYLALPRQQKIEKYYQ